MRPEDDPENPAYWRAVERAEQEARKKGRSLPRCRLCTKPLWVGQDEVHFACAEAAATAEPQQGRRLLVCGSRHWKAEAVLHDVLDRQTVPVQALAHGCAPGADRMAGEWATSRGIPVYRYPADWQGLGSAAGPVRNRRMLEEFQPARVVAFKDRFDRSLADGSGGTEDMVRVALAAGVACWTCDSSGSVERITRPPPPGQAPSPRRHRRTAARRTAPASGQPPPVLDLHLGSEPGR